MTGRTAVEIADDGTALRIFHRQGTSAWTHPIDDSMIRTTGRHSAIVTRPCPVCARATGKANGRASGRRKGPETASVSKGEE